MLQRVVACCSTLQCVASECLRNRSRLFLPRVAACCRVLQRVVVKCSVLHLGIFDAGACCMCACASAEMGVCVCSCVF